MVKTQKKFKFSELSEITSFIYYKHFLNIKIKDKYLVKKIILIDKEIIKLVNYPIDE